MSDPELVGDAVIGDPKEPGDRGDVILCLSADGKYRPPKMNNGDILQIAGRTVVANATIVRSANTTAYAAKNCINSPTPAVITFANILSMIKGSGYVVGGKVLTNQYANIARFRLWLFYASAITIPADNAALTIMWANRANLLDSITFDAASSEGVGSDCSYTSNSDIAIPVQQPNNDQNLYGLLETLDAFTPISAQNFFISLALEQN